MAPLTGPVQSRGRGPLGWRATPPGTPMRTLWTPLLALVAIPQEPARPAPDLAAAQVRLEQIERRLADERTSWLEFRRLAGSAEERSEMAAAFPRDEFAG